MPEVFIKAYQELRTLRRWDNFVGWLYRITTNQCKDWIRSNSRRPDGVFAEDQEPCVVDRPALDSYREKMVYESVREALDSVPEIYSEDTNSRYAEIGGIAPGVIISRRDHDRSHDFRLANGHKRTAETCCAC